MRLYSVLAQVRFTTGKTKLVFYYKKPGIRVASRDAERRKTKDLRELGNFREISNLGEYIA